MKNYSQIGIAKDFIAGETRRKGSIMDVLFLTIPLALMFLFTVVAYEIFSTFKENAANSGVGLDQSILKTGLGSIAILDQGIIFLFGGMVLVTMYLAHQLNISKLFVVPGMFVLGLFAYFFAQIANMVGEVTSSSLLGESANEFAMTTVFFNNLPVIGTIVGVIILILMVTNIGRSGGQA